MIWLHAALAWAGTAGVQAQLTGWNTSARHALTPGINAWVSAGPRPWSVTGEVSGLAESGTEDLYATSTVLLRTSATLDLALGTHATTFRVGIGPSVAWRLWSVDLDGAQNEGLAVEPGGRVRVALDGPIAGPVAWCWHVAATSRRLALDWDAGLGLGVHW